MNAIIVKCNDNVRDFRVKKSPNRSLFLYCQANRALLSELVIDYYVNSAKLILCKRVY